MKSLDFKEFGVEFRMRITQRERILRHLNDFGQITSYEAFKDYGITRLSAVIWTLKHKFGYNIESERTYCINRYGEKTRFSNYKLVMGEI